MDKAKVQTALQSRAVRFAIGALVALIVKWAGIPMLPDDVTQEVIFVIIAGIDTAVGLMIIAAAWFRIKARKIIENIF